MGKLSFLLKLGGLIYIALIIKSKGKSKRPFIGLSLLLLYILKKVHEIGCWKYKLKNKNVRIMFHSPGTGTLRWIIKYGDLNFHPMYIKEAIKNIQESKEKFVIFANLKVNHFPNFNYNIFDAKIIKYIFEDNFHDYIKGPVVHDTFEELFGDGIFASDPPSWKFHRKVASRMFSMRNLKNYMFDCALENTSILLNKMDDLSGTNNQNELDLFDLFGRFTLQSFIQSAFGERLPIIESLPNKHQFCSSFDSLILECEHRTIDPLWQVKRWLRIGQREGNDIPYNTKVLDDFALKIITDRNKKQNITDESGAKHDLLTLFMKHGQIESKELNKKEIRDITMNFVIAARDTTRILLSWFFYEVTKVENIPILEKIITEIDKYGNEKLEYNDCAPYSGGGRSVSVQNKSQENGIKSGRKYQYLEAVMCEILRLYPPVPFLQRHAKRDVRVPYETFDGVRKELILDKGDGVSVYTNGYLRMPSIWGTNGRDPNKITIENFYENGVNTYTPYVFPVFNLNPRLCLGKTSALLQAKIIIISILRKYNVEAVKNQNIVAVLSPILVMKPGFKVRVTPRKQVSYRP